MPIISLEGASGVGKSTTAQELMNQVDAYVVPEVNELFQRPSALPENWYFERQVERWKIAQEKAKQHEWIVLDGDVFQPFWYNWSYHFQEFGQSLDAIRDFYRPHLENGPLGFPDRYFLLYVDGGELRKRKENDTARRRGNFEKHLAMIEPQKRYFQEMNRRAAELVEFIEARDAQKNVEKMTASRIASFNSVHPLELFDGMIGWLQKNRA